MSVVFEMLQRSGPITWFSIMQCVSTELFPVFSTKISECLQEKRFQNSAFQMNDISDEVVEDVISRLQQKRATNNTEIMYFKKLIQRAIEGPVSHDSYVFSVIKMSKIHELNFWNYKMNNINDSEIMWNRVWGVGVCGNMWKSKRDVHTV